MKKMVCICFHVATLLHTLFRGTGVILVLLLLANRVPAQDRLLASTVKAQDLPMPPKITMATVPHCDVITHSVEISIDAKTGLSQEHFMFRAEPSATTKGKTWTLRKETIRAGRDLRPGALGDYDTIEEAAKVCSQWLNAVREEKQRVTAREKQR